MANQADIYAARDRATARARIEQIYANRGAPVPPNIDQLVARAMSDPNYFDQVRVHAANDAQTLQRPTGPPLTNLPGGRGPQDTAGHAKDAAIGLVGGGGSLGDDDAIRAEIRRIWSDLTGGAMVPSGALLEQYVQIVKRHGHYNRVREMASKWGGGGRSSRPGGGGDPFGGGDATSSRNWMSDAGAMFPWLPPPLLRLFADKWAESGDANLALGYVRAHGSYEQYFPGIKRDNGALRMSEQEYFATEAAFGEILTEFGWDPATYRKKYGNLFRNDVSATEFARTVGDLYESVTEPGGKPPRDLMNTFLDQFIGSGSAVTAWEKTRDTDLYNRYFDGIRRDDGTLRMNEREYMMTKHGYRSWLEEYSLNSKVFESKMPDLIRGDVSVEEFAGRLRAVDEGIQGNIEQVRDYYATNYGLRLTREAILASAIDPDIGQQVLTRRISVAQVGGEAARAGFSRSTRRAEQLVGAGLGQAQARSLYAAAGERLPTLGALTRRYYDPSGGFTLEQFEDVAVFEDPTQKARMRRRYEDEAAAFSPFAALARNQAGGLSGLRQR